jgi:hypothetical protein
MCKLRTCWPGIAERFEQLSQIFARMGGKTVHAFRPGVWPLDGLHPFSGQAKGQVKTAYTGLTGGRRLMKEFLKRWEGFKLPQLL